MAHDIDEVWQLCKDIQTELNQLQPIKEKCDEIIATLALKQDITITCTRCKGTGKVLSSISQSGGGLVEIDCPECVGKGWNIVGSINEVEA